MIISRPCLFCHHLVDVIKSVFVILQEYGSYGIVLFVGYREKQKNKAVDNNTLAHVHENASSLAAAMLATERTLASKHEADYTSASSSSSPSPVRNHSDDEFSTALDESTEASVSDDFASCAQDETSMLQLDETSMLVAEPKCVRVRVDSLSTGGALTTSAEGTESEVCRRTLGLSSDEGMLWEGEAITSVGVRRESDLLPNQQIVHDVLALKRKLDDERFRERFSLLLVSRLHMTAFAFAESLVR